MSEVKELEKIKQEVQQKNELEVSRPQYAVLGARMARILNMAGQGSGKSAMIGILTGLFVHLFPGIKGFVAANTYMQLNQSTLIQCTKIWAQYFNLKRYDPSTGKGDYVIDAQPPRGFRRVHEFKSYQNIISFKNGHTIYVGSLDNYLAHDGKEFAYAHLDETKDTRESALKSVILARLREPGIWHNTADDNPQTNLLYGKTKEEVIANVVKNRVAEAKAVAIAGAKRSGITKTTELLKIAQKAGDKAAKEPVGIKEQDLLPFNPCYIHTSPAEGTVEWLTTMFKLEEKEHDILDKIVSETDFYYNEEGNRAVAIYSTYHNQKNLPTDYIQNRLNDLTEAQALKFVYGYPFSKTGGEFFTQFDRIKHIKPAEFIKFAPIHITLDFNVLPYMTLLAAQMEELETVFRIRVFKEYCLKSPLNSTRAVCEAFLLDYQDDITDLFYYGDASGKNRIAGKGDITNYDDLKEVLEYYLTSASDRVSRRNKPIMKRREFIERILAGKVYLGTKRVELIIDPACKETIKDFQYLMLGVDGKLKELAKNEEGASYQKLGHTSDALEYLICEILADLM